jgi:hypothetical protein
MTNDMCDLRCKGLHIDPRRCPGTPVQIDVLGNSYCRYRKAIHDKGAGFAEIALPRSPPPPLPRPGLARHADQLPAVAALANGPVGVPGAAVATVPAETYEQPGAATVVAAAAGSAEIGSAVAARAAVTEYEACVATHTAGAPAATAETAGAT